MKNKEFIEIKVSYFVFILIIVFANEAFLKQDCDVYQRPEVPVLCFALCVALCFAGTTKI